LAAKNGKWVAQVMLLSGAKPVIRNRTWTRRRLDAGSLLVSPAAILTVGKCSAALLLFAARIRSEVAADAVTDAIALLNEIAMEYALSPGMFVSNLHQKTSLPSPRYAPRRILHPRFPRAHLSLEDLLG
jgi:hypothetical protein